MESNFTFGHTLQPEVEESSQEDLEQLFKIGNQHIEIPQSPQHSDSDSTPLQTHRSKKINKQDKHSSKDNLKHKIYKKHKKNRNKNQDALGEDLQLKSKLVISDSEGKEGKLVLFKQKKDISERKDRWLSSMIVEESQLFQSSFEVGKKMGEKLLSYDIVSFGFAQLYQYGLMDKDIPHYSRLPLYNQIVGSQLRQPKQILKSIAQKINQRIDHLYNNQKSQHRYFHYHGYDNLTPLKLHITTPTYNKSQFLPFKDSLPSEEVSLRNNRDIHTQLNLNPQDVDLWLRFARLQKQQSYPGHGPKNQSGIIDRQLSIIQKAISLNSHNLPLSLARLQLLLQKQTDYSLLQQQCHELIKFHPGSQAPWKLYLKMQISEFHLYSHPLARRKFEQLIQLFRSFIESTRSAMQVWKIRRAGLQLVKSMILVYKLQGYGQLATGLVIALIDFNFFMPEALNKASQQQRIKAFAQYWQKQSAYKLGQLPRIKGWQDQVVTQLKQAHDLQPEGFISSLGGCRKDYKKSIIQKQIQMQEEVWRPSHPLHDRSTIRMRPDSYILIQDIEFALHPYSDGDSLLGLLDLLADHLELPEIFNYSGYNSQFSFSLVQQALITQNNNLAFRDRFYWWKRYWNPIHTDKIISQGKVVKLQYLRRILEGVKMRLPSQQQYVSRYLLFINCCYLCSQNVRRQLNISEADILAGLEGLLTENSPHNIAVWSIYIHTTHQLKKNTQQCIECYLQLLDTNSQAIRGSSTIQLSIVYQLWVFISEHRPLALGNLLRLYLCLLDHDWSQLTLKSQLSIFQQQRLCRYLQQKLDGMEKTRIAEGLIVQDIQLCLLLVDCWEEGYLEELSLRRGEVVSWLEEWMFKGSGCFLQHYLVCEVTRRGILRAQFIQEKSLFSSLPYFDLVHYWLCLHPQPLVTLLSHPYIMQFKSLPLWIVCSMILIQQRNYQALPEYFFVVGKELCFQGPLWQQSPQYIILFNRLLLAHSIQNHSDFIQYSLKQIPYGKELYLIALMSICEPRQKNNILTLMQQKGIRLLQPSLIQL